MSEQKIKGLEVTAERCNFDRDVRLWLFRKGLVDVQVAKPIEFVTDEGQAAEPTLYMSRDVAQNLMDALWATGMRPSNGEGANAQVTAMKHHLEDMRKLVFEQRIGRG